MPYSSNFLHFGFDLKDLDGPRKPKLPGRNLPFPDPAATEKPKPDKLELSGIGIFGGTDEAEDKSDAISDDEYVDEVRLHVRFQSAISHSA